MTTVGTKNKSEGIMLNEDNFIEWLQDFKRILSHKDAVSQDSINFMIEGTPIPDRILPDAHGAAKKGDDFLPVPCTKCCEASIDEDVASGSVNFPVRLAFEYRKINTSIQTNCKVLSGVLDAAISKDGLNKLETHSKYVEYRTANQVRLMWLCITKLLQNSGSIAHANATDKMLQISAITEEYAGHKLTKGVLLATYLNELEAFQTRMFNLGVDRDCSVYQQVWATSLIRGACGRYMDFFRKAQTDNELKHCKTYEKAKTIVMTWDQRKLTMRANDKAGVDKSINVKSLSTNSSSSSSSSRTKKRGRDGDKNKDDDKRKKSSSNSSNSSSSQRQKQTDGSNPVLKTQQSDTMKKKYCIFCPGTSDHYVQECPVISSDLRAKATKSRQNYLASK